VRMPQWSFGAVTEDLLGLIEQAVARIEQGEGAEAALREMQASLLEIKAMVERDPGIRMAADDLYEAAAALVAGKSAGPDLMDVRRWRLLVVRDRTGSCPCVVAGSGGLPRADR